MSIEKIAINGHYVWVDKDAEIKEGDRVWWKDPAGETSQVNTVIEVHDDMIFMSEPKASEIEAFPSEVYKIMAASPELKLEGVPTYVEWLAEQAYPSAHFGLSIEAKRERKAFINGYQTAEKELPTWDDVRKAIGLVKPIEFPRSLWNKSIEEIIEQFKESKK